MSKRRWLFTLSCAGALQLPLVFLPLPVTAQEPVHWDVVSPITPSPALRRAQEYLTGRMEAIGLVQVHTEPWGEHTVGWEMERVSVHMLEPDYQMVIAYPLAFTPGTGRAVVERAVMAVIESAEDMNRLRGQLEGAIVLATPPMPTMPRFVQDAFRHNEESLHVFETEGVDLLSARHARGQLGQASFRPGISADEVEQFFKEEGVAVILRASIGSDGTVAAGGRSSSRSDRSREGIENALPTLSVAAEHYKRVCRSLERGIPVTMEVEVRVLIDDSDPRGYKVIAEIPGTDLAHEVVAVGGHLDAWHSGTGATENAGGVAVALEAMRILKAIDARPRRTIRILLWSHEEGGL